MMRRAQNHSTPRRVRPHMAHGILANSRSRSSLVASISAALQNLDPLTPFIPHLSPSLVAQVINSQSDPRLSLRFFRWAVSQGADVYSPTTSCFFTIISHLLSRSCFSAAASLVEPVAHPSSVSDPIISKFIKSYGDLGDVTGALQWFRRAGTFRIPRSPLSYNAILAVLVRASRIGLAREIFDEMLRNGTVHPDVTTFTTMIRGFCKLGRIRDAQRLFEEMSYEPNLVTYNTIIDGFCRRKLVQDARRILERMIESGKIMPDAITFTTLISGYCKIGDLNSAIAIMNEMAAWNCEPNLVTYNSLVYGFCVEGRVEEAEKMIERMVLKGFKPDVATHTSLMKGYCVTGKLDAVVRQLNVMLNSGLKPDAKAYGVVVNEYCKTGNTKAAMAVVEDMKGQGLVPHIGSFNAILRALCGLGEIDVAVNVLKQIPRPTFVSFSTVICSLCQRRGRMRDAEDLVVMMMRKGHIPDASMYNVMVNGYCENNEVDMALGTYKEMVEKRLVINLDSFSLLVRGLNAAGKDAEAEKIAAATIQTLILTNSFDLPNTSLHQSTTQESSIPV